MITGLVVLQAMVDTINSAFVHILHFPEAMKLETPLSVYGIDSLAAVKLRKWIRTGLGALVITLDVSNAASSTKSSRNFIVKIIESSYVRLRFRLE